MDFTNLLQNLSTALEQTDETISLSNFISNNFPSIDLVDGERYIKIYVELPGVEKKNISIDFFNNKVEISAVRNKDYTETATKNEIQYGDVKRKVLLPISITNKESVVVTYNNGVLKLVIDKMEEEKNKFHMSFDDDNSL